MDPRALLDAAEKRWDNQGSYTWQIPLSRVRTLQAELAGGIAESDHDVLDAHTQFSVYAEPSPDPGYDTQGRVIPSATAQAGE